MDSDQWVVPFIRHGLQVAGDFRRYLAFKSAVLVKNICTICGTAMSRLSLYGDKYLILLIKINIF
ncbi:MAG: hypothetical protein CSA32_02320 [Desulfobulbus propionicus]|nr:MAG: hypothetical protein CSA32_02320 [Desulfobulbus propionicus]